MKRSRARHAAAGFVATLGISTLARAVDIEPLHVDMSIRGRSFGADTPDCEGGEWSLNWQGDFPGESRNIGDLLISYGSFDTTIEDEEDEEATVHAKPSFNYTTLVCRNAKGEIMMRSTMVGPGPGKIRGLLAMKKDPANRVPFFIFDVNHVGVCRQALAEGGKYEQSSSR